MAGREFDQTTGYAGAADRGSADGWAPETGQARY
jgi:hypothetical protein